MRRFSIVVLATLLATPMSESAAAAASAIETIDAPVSRSGDPWSRVRQELVAKGLDPVDIEIPGEVTDEMVEWARQQVQAESPREQVDELLSALIDPDRLGLEYSPERTGTAKEVFETRRANCLAFTHLFVGLSRSLGVPTIYVHWNRIERFRRDEDLVVVSGHISAGQRSSSELVVLRFGAVTGLEARGVTPISDLNALARHYSNRSVELLSRGELEAAVESGELAVAVDPSLAHGWVNLGVAKRRSGDWIGAEMSYSQAVEVDPDNLSAYRNLQALFTLRGDEDAADRIFKLLHKRGCRDPFVYLELGDEGMASDAVEEAGRYYRRAYKYGPDLAETRAARGLWHLDRGDLRKAIRWLQRAQRIDASESRTRLLGSRLGLPDRASI